jgi:uncharacterized glyoxalase superfamily protein PhnB
MPAQPIPEDYPAVSPYLAVQDVDGLINFLEQSFGGEELRRELRPDGSIMHAEVWIGDSIIMIGGTPDDARHTSAMLHVYVDDVDAVYERALQAGATAIEKPAAQPDGDRRGGVKDASGHRWWIATSISTREN